MQFIVFVEREGIDGKNFQDLTIGVRRLILKRRKKCLASVWYQYKWHINSLQYHSKSNKWGPINGHVFTTLFKVHLNFIKA